MPTYTTSIIYGNATSSFQAWTQAVDAGIRAVGLITSSDLNQGNLATATPPSGAANYTVSRVYQFNDAFQSTSPVFIKMEYGANANVNALGIRISVAPTTNGSGSLTGTSISTPLKVCGGGANGIADNISECYFSGDTNRLTMCLFQNNTNTCVGLLSVERTHDANGNDTNNGIYLVVGSGGNATWFSQTLQVNPLNAPPTMEINGFLAVQSTNASTAWGDGFAFGPAMPSLGIALNPSLCVGAYANSDFNTTGGTFQVNHYGVVQQWFATGNIFTVGSSGQARVAMRWE